MPCARPQRPPCPRPTPTMGMSDEGRNADSIGGGRGPPNPRACRFGGCLVPGQRRGGRGRGGVTGLHRARHGRHAARRRRGLVLAVEPHRVYVVSGACSLDAFNARTCTFLLRSEPTSVKPRVLSAPNVAAGPY